MQHLGIWGSLAKPFVKLDISYDSIKRLKHLICCCGSSKVSIFTLVGFLGVSFTPPHYR